MQGIHARVQGTPSLEFISKNLGFTQVKGDYEKFDVPQRGVDISHSSELGQIAIKSFQTNPSITPFPTSIVLRLIPNDERQLAVFVKALKDGKNFQKYVKWSYAIDGQHRLVGCLRLPEEVQADLRLDVSYVICDDTVAEKMFFDINSLGKKMAPSIVDLSLAKQLIAKTLINEPRHQARAIAALLTREFIPLDHPYNGRIERPLAVPEVKGAIIRFHKLVGSFGRAPAYYIRDSSTRDDGSLDVESVMDDVKFFGNQAAAVWKAIEFEIGDIVFDADAKFGTVDGRGWNHPHLLNILMEGLVNEAILMDKTQRTYKEYRDLIAKPLAAFFKWGIKDQIFASGFHNLGGSSGDAKYIAQLKAYFKTNGEEPTEIKIVEIEDETEEFEMA